jgi:hypothetical protein
LSLKCHPNHDASFTSKALITSAHVGGHDANPTNTISSSLQFALSSLVTASDEQNESIPNDEIALLVRKFRALHKFLKERRRSPRGCYECGDTTHFITDCPKGKKFDSSNMYIYANRNDSSNKGDNKIMSRVCAALNDFDFSSDDSSSKKGDFTKLCLMGKSSSNDSDSDVSDDLSLKCLSSKVVELEDALLLALIKHLFHAPAC